MTPENCANCNKEIRRMDDGWEHAETSLFACGDNFDFIATAKPAAPPEAKPTFAYNLASENKVWAMVYGLGRAGQLNNQTVRILWPLLVELVESQSELASLRETISKLEDEYGRLQRTMEFQQESYLKEHGNWGDCKFRLEVDKLEATISTLQGENQELRELLSDAILWVKSGFHKRRLNLKLISLAPQPVAPDQPKGENR